MFRKAKKPTATEIAEAKATEHARSQTRIEMSLSRMEKKSQELGRLRAESRALCTLPNHDRCLSH